MIGVVAANLAERDGHRRLTGEVNHAAVERLPLIGAGDGAGPRVDGQRGGQLAVAAARMGRFAIDQVHRVISASASVTSSKVPSSW